MKKTITTLSTCLLMAGSSQASLMIISETTDAQAINEGVAGSVNGRSGTTDGTDDGPVADTSVVADNATTLRVGRYLDATSAPEGSNSAAVFVFHLPDLGNVADPFATATFTFNVTGVSTLYNVDLAGLGIRDTSEVLAADFEFATTSDSTAETSLHTTILNTDTDTIGSKTSNDFASYLNTQYDSGANKGKYLFLRIDSTGGSTKVFNAGPTIQNGWDITSADSATNKPTLNYTLVPEPSSSALLGLGIAGLAFRRQRRS